MRWVVSLVVMAFVMGLSWETWHSRLESHSQSLRFSKIIHKLGIVYQKESGNISPSKVESSPTPQHAATSGCSAWRLSHGFTPFDANFSKILSECTAWIILHSQKKIHAETAALVESKANLHGIQNQQLNSHRTHWYSSVYRSTFLALSSSRFFKEVFDVICCRRFGLFWAKVANSFL